MYFTFKGITLKKFVIEHLQTDQHLQTCPYSRKEEHKLGRHFPCLGSPLSSCRLLPMEWNGSQGRNACYKHMQRRERVSEGVPGMGCSRISSQWSSRSWWVGRELELQESVYACAATFAHSSHMKEHRLSMPAWKEEMETKERKMMKQNYCTHKINFSPHAAHNDLGLS